MKRKLISVLIDGVSADTFELHKSRLPNMSSLAQTGLRVKRLHSDMPAVSVPGRATMLTGATSAEHGIYGNYIVRDGAFVLPQPTDVRIQTLAGLAKRDGLDVASIGHGLVAPSDTSICVPPWWVRGTLLGARFIKSPPPPELVTEARTIFDPEGRLERLPGLEDFTNPKQENALPVFANVIGDQFMNRAASFLLSAESAPDLILTEINMTDSLQHTFGYDGTIALWALEAADLLVGNILRTLERTGRLDQYVISIASDHGHGPVDAAILPGALLSDFKWSDEGATLHVLVRDEEERRIATARLAPLGVEPWNESHVPVDMRESIATFVAPPGHSFESRLESDSKDMIGAPGWISTHGFRPGSSADDRLFILSGADIEARTVETAAATKFTPTLADVLGLPLDGFSATSILRR